MARRRDTMGQEGRYRFAHYHMLLFSVFQGAKRANWEDNTFDRFEKKNTLSREAKVLLLMPSGNTLII